MSTTVEGILADINEATAPCFRGQLLARGQARSMIWRDGKLPPNAPDFSLQLSYDLYSYGYSLLGLGLRLLEMEGDAEHARRAFEQAASALESVIVRGDSSDGDRCFHFVMTAAAYHLAHLSARAYSLLSIVRTSDNFSSVERVLAQLMLRDFKSLDALVLVARDTGSDASIAAGFKAKWEAENGDTESLDDDQDSFLLDGVDLALTDNFLGAIAIFLLALEHGERALVENAIKQLKEGVAICAELNLVPQWWAHRIAIHLLKDLWDSSYHERLPLEASGGETSEWVRLRNLFIAVLLKRKKAEIDLWPSQIIAASRAVDQSDDLVISLPTSAGKTRIAELCILRCLAGGKRVVFVTPLRALSAQTEMILQRTFSPLGKTVSALYGSIGVNSFDQNAIRQRDIVVATPEKLDFALRNDPSLLDAVGLLVFDEGHMIGLNEREVRYEAQIQRLLRRSDAQQRRIVCLSAILPDGDQVEDFTNWLRRDQPGGLVKSDWRPTRLRFGEVIWDAKKQAARLDLRVDDEQPFVPQFLTGFIPPIGKREKVFPKDLGELCVATAWKLVADGQSVLIFCPVRTHVEPFATRIIDLYKRGALISLLVVDEEKLNKALVLGKEWLGRNHPILECLRLGVAIHHGALPTAYRKEIEQLLQEGVLKVTISSPTLAQGLNLSATAVIFHSLSRNKKPIEASEFKNVVGRAGRAYIDVEGLVLHPIFNKRDYRVKEWKTLINDTSSREMESGLILLVLSLLRRMNKRTNDSLTPLTEYVLNNAMAWSFPKWPDENSDDQGHANKKWENQTALLDTAILSLMGDQEIADDAVAATLDDVLQSSLWQRRLARDNDEGRAALSAGLVSRAKYIWSHSTVKQRKGYFFAGIGLSTGHALDALAPVGNELLVKANGAILNHDELSAIESITSLAEHVFSIPPFAPEKIPKNWQEILRSWLFGLPMDNFIGGNEANALQFIEGGLGYRLPWAMEAIRVRGLANGDTIGKDQLTLDNFELSLAVSAVETGTLNISASILIRAGFGSRIASIKAVNDTEATFSNASGLRQWLLSEGVRVHAAQADWPTPETHELWLSFVHGPAVRLPGAWKELRYLANHVIWNDEQAPPNGTPVRLMHLENQTMVISAEGLPIGKVNAALNPTHSGLLRGQVVDGILHLSYLGPNDLWRD